MLGQNRRFNGLHWFEEIEDRFKTEIEQFDAEQKSLETKKQMEEINKKKKKSSKEPTVAPVLDDDVLHSEALKLNESWETGNH